MIGVDIVGIMGGLVYEINQEGYGISLLHRRTIGSCRSADDKAEDAGDFRQVSLAGVNDGLGIVWCAAIIEPEVNRVMQCVWGH